MACRQQGFRIVVVVVVVLVVELPGD